MRTPVNRIVRCVGGYESGTETPKVRQPWLCPPTPSADAVTQYEQFWENTLKDTTAIDTFYDQQLEASGVPAEVDAMLADDTAWRAKLERMDAEWALLNAQRAAENVTAIEHAEQTSKEIAVSLGALAAIPLPR